MQFDMDGRLAVILSNTSLLVSRGPVPGGGRAGWWAGAPNNALHGRRFHKPRVGNVWKSAFRLAHSLHGIFFVLEIVSFASLWKGGRLGREALDAYAPDHTRRRPYLCGAETRVAYGPTATPATAAAFFIPW